MIVILATILQTFGLFLIFGSVYYAIFLADHNEIYAHVMHKPSFLIVFAGLFGVLLATTHFRDIWELLKVIVLNPPSKLDKQVNYASENLEKMTDSFYKEGVPGINKAIDRDQIPAVWGTVIDQIEAKIDPKDISLLVQRQFIKLKERFQHKIKIIEMLIGAAPSLGMFGTVLGLVKLLASLTDYSTIGPNMSLALITTLYGIFASILLNPIAKHIENKLIKNAKAYEQVLFWLAIVKDKKPAFFMAKDYGKL